MRILGLLWSAAACANPGPNKELHGAGLSRDSGDAYLVATSPGAIYKDLLVQGTRVGEEEGAAPGEVRAYDVRTGAIRWTFHTIPHPGEFGYDTWPPGAWQTAGGA